MDDKLESDEVRKIVDRLVALTRDALLSLERESGETHDEDAFQRRMAMVATCFVVVAGKDASRITLVAVRTLVEYAIHANWPGFEGVTLPAVAN